MKISGKSFPKYFSVVFSLLACTAYLASLFAPVERLWHDRAFLRGVESLKTGDPRLLLIAIDDDTVRTHGFPLPRTVQAQALEKLRKYGVKTVVFDVLFMEKREGDAELAAATKRHGGVVHLFTTEQEENASGVMSTVRKPVPGLASAARLLGTPIISRHIESDGHIRNFSLFHPGVKDPILPSLQETSLAAAALAAFLDKKLEELHTEFGGPDAPTYVLNYRRTQDWLQHEKRDESWLKNTPEEKAKRMGVTVLDSPYRTISMMDIISGSLSDAQLKALKGSLAMVASTTVGYYDHYPTPFTSHAPGAEYHLNVIDNIMAADYLRISDIGLNVLLVLIAAWLPYFFVTFLPTAFAAAAAVVTLILASFASSLIMGQGTMLYPVAPGLSMLVSFLVLTVHRVLTEGAEKQMIKAKFGQFVSPEIVEELANNPEMAKLGAQRREMTAFFLDIAHFTTISEKMTAEQLIVFLNSYLSSFSEVILDHRGTIDKFIGDCIMAFWNAPLENKDHARDAVLSALRCQVAIAELNKNLAPGLAEAPAIRIGINTGQMNVGFTGTERKLAYTVLGDEVNLASRLEGANKFFGSQIMISGATYEGAKSAVEVRYLGRARVVGKAASVPVYEPLAEKGKLPAAWTKALPVWEKGIKAFYEKKYEESLAVFTEYAKLMPGDGAGELYLNLSRDYSALPPDDWDQVFNLTAK